MGISITMPPRMKLSTLDQEPALGWLQDGVYGRDVSRRLRVSHSIIQHRQARFQTTGSAEEHPGSGRQDAPLDAMIGTSSS